MIEHRWFFNFPSHLKRNGTLRLSAVGHQFASTSSLGTCSALLPLLCILCEAWAKLGGGRHSKKPQLFQPDMILLPRQALSTHSAQALQGWDGRASGQWSKTAMPGDLTTNGAQGSDVRMPHSCCSKLENSVC